MSDDSLTQEVTVTNEQGLHARPADLLVREASRYESTIEIIKETERVDAKSILSVLTLGATKGTKLIIEASGPDASEALRALMQMFQEGFKID